MSKRLPERGHPADHRTRNVVFGVACRGCPLRAQCTASATGRTLHVHEHDAILRAHQARWHTAPDLQAPNAGTGRW